MAVIIILFVHLQLDRNRNVTIAVKTHFRYLKPAYLCFLKLWKALSVGKFCLLSLSTLNGTPPKGDLIKFSCDTLKRGSYAD